MSPDFDTVFIRGNNPDKPQQIIGRKKVPKRKIDDDQEMPPTVIINGVEETLTDKKPLSKPADDGTYWWQQD